MSSGEISLQDYVDIRIKNVESKLDSQRDLFTQHFELVALALKKSENGTLRHTSTQDLQLAEMSKDIESLKLTRSFSNGKMWMVMAIFATVPTVLALIALFRG